MAALTAAAMAAVTINPEKRLSMTISFCPSFAREGCQALVKQFAAHKWQACDKLLIVAEFAINIAGLPKNEIWHVPLGSSIGDAIRSTQRLKRSASGSIRYDTPPSLCIA
jgi:hypothetical protein